MIEQRPHVLIELDNHPTIFRPNQAISGRYRLDMSRWRSQVQALEWSIAWATEGKGDLDQGVHATKLEGPEGYEGVSKPDQWR